MRSLRSVLENCFITSIGEFLQPTPRKMQDLLRAALTLPEELEGLRRETVSHLASYRRFDDLAPDYCGSPPATTIRWR